MVDTERTTVQHNFFSSEGERRIVEYQAGSQAMRAAELPDMSVAEVDSTITSGWAYPRGLAITADNYTDASRLDRVANEIERRLGKDPDPAITSTNDVRVQVAAIGAAAAEKSGALLASSRAINAAEQSKQKRLEEPIVLPRPFSFPNNPRDYRRRR